MDFTLDIVRNDEFIQLIDLWELSVRASHSFVAESTIDFYKPIILNELLPLFDIISVRDEQSKIIGFAAVKESNLEMLYILPDYFRKGIGSFLLSYCLDNMNVRKVDVIEENIVARKFYEKFGFVVADRSNTDIYGKPYPLLHLQLFGYRELIVNSDISLRQLRSDDSIDIFKTIDTQREYLGLWLPFVEHTKELSDTEKFVSSIVSKDFRSGEYIFTIRYKNKFAGLIGFKATDKQNRKTEIGYWLSQDMQKKGLVSKSLRRLHSFAFDELGLNRIQVRCAVGNSASSNIPKKLGYKFEGIERAGELLSGGKFVDLELYSLLNSDSSIIK